MMRDNVKIDLNKMISDMINTIRIPYAKTRIFLEEPRLNRHYQNVIRKIKKNNGKIRFAAFVMYDTDFGGDGVIKEMLCNQDKWNPKLVIIPDISRGIKNAREVYKRTKKYCQTNYGLENVLDGWDMNSNFYDLMDSFDIIYFTCPYDNMAHPFHQIKKSIHRDVLPIYITYAFEGIKYYALLRYRSFEINYLWKCYTDTKYTLDDYVRYELRKGRNVVLVGYAKMDKLAEYKKGATKEKKTILISPHHTVDDPNLPMSNFLKYYKFFLKLPIIFPEVDFIFRPHPLLFPTLVNKKIWTEEQIDKYLSELQKRGVEYSSGGDYFELFSRSDAMINDCGSYTVEWLYTGKKSCFMRNPRLKDSNLTSLMKLAIQGQRVVYNEEDIIRFINDVLNDLNDNYEMKSWVKSNIAINYPNVSKKLVDDMYSSIYYG